MKRVALFSVSALVIGAIALFATFQSLSTCSLCGCRGHSIEFQLPFTDVTYCRIQNVQQTPLSQVGKQLALVSAHRHDWKLIHGSGNGIMCAIGRGADLDRNARSTQVASFVADTARYRDRVEAARWFKTALDARNSKAVFDWLLDYPEHDMGTSQDYEKWRARADHDWPEFVERNRRP